MEIHISSDELLFLAPPNDSSNCFPRWAHFQSSKTFQNTTLSHDGKQKTWVSATPFLQKNTTNWTNIDVILGEH